MRVCGPSESGEGDTSDLHAYHSMRVPEVVQRGRVVGGCLASPKEAIDFPHAITLSQRTQHPNLNDLIAQTISTSRISSKVHPLTNLK